MKTSVFKIFTVLLAVISFSLLPSCVVEDPEALAALLKDSVADIEGSSDDGAVAGGSVTALTIAEKVTVIDVNTRAQKPAFALALERAAAANLISGYPDSDYAVAAANQDVYIVERADEGFAIANMLLCYMHQLAYEDMTGKGAYVALVDNTLCEDDKGNAEDNASAGMKAANDSQNSGGGSGGDEGAVQYEQWTVVSYRASDTSPQNVRFWINDEGGDGGGDCEDCGGPPMTIEARLVIDEGKSDKNPFGIFNLNFRGIITKETLAAYEATLPAGETLPAGVSSSADYETMKGSLQTIYNTTTNKIELKLMMSEGMPDDCVVRSSLNTSTLVRDQDTAGALTGAGYGKVEMTRTQTVTSDSTVYTACKDDDKITTGWDNTGTPNAWLPLADVKKENLGLEMAFSDTNFKRKDRSCTDSTKDAATCLAENSNFGQIVCLDRTDPVESAWQYALFNDEYVTGNEGSALHLNTGYPIEWTTTEGQQQGYVGYWGLWDPTNSLKDGDIVQKKAWGDAVPINLTVFQSDGKLHKHSKKLIPLSSLTGVELYAGMDDGTNTGMWKQYILKWNGTKLQIVGEIDESNWEPTFYGAGNEVDYVPANAWEQDLWFWAQSLNGGGRLNVIASQYGASSDITFGTNTISQTGGTFVTNGGFVEGDTIIISNSTSNDGSYTIATGGATDTVLTVVETLTPEGMQWPSLSRLNPLTNFTNAKFQVESTVEPGDTSVPATFACLDQCPDPSVLDTYDSNSAEPHFAISTWNAPAGTALWDINQGTWDNTGAYTAGLEPTAAAHGSGTTEIGFIGYKFNPTTYALNLGLDGSGLAVAQTADASGNNWGVHSGAMFDPTDNTNWAALACDWDATITCTWKTHDLATFYTWETGMESWNKYTGVKKDTGAILQFSPPLQVDYTHVADGKKYMLEYNGYGELSGVPGVCVSVDTGLEVDCWSVMDWRSVRWTAKFSIPDGAILTAVNPRDGTSDDYYSLALEKEQRLIGVADAYCDTLYIQPLDLPTTDDYADPTVGTQPEVTDAPAVIGGVVQATLVP